MIGGIQTVLTPNIGNGVFTVLTPPSSASIADSIFLNQINALNASQIVNKQNRIQTTLVRELNQIGFEQFALTDLREGADDALKFIDDTVSRINLIRSQLDNAIKVALQADGGDSQSFPALASSFNSFVAS